MADPKSKDTRYIIIETVLMGKKVSLHYFNVDINEDENVVLICKEADEIHFE